MNHCDSRGRSILQQAANSACPELREAAALAAVTFGVDEHAHSPTEASSSEDSLALTLDFLDWIARERDREVDLPIYHGLTHAIQLAASWIKEHFSSHPGDRHRFSDLIQAVERPYFPWQVVRPEAQGLALLYNFSPFQDTGATVASKRLRDFGASVDVVSCSFLHRKKVDRTVEAIAEPYVASRHFLQLPASWASWEPYKAFAVQANKYADRLMEEGAAYEFLYTRAMWAPSLYAGALFKQRHPEIRWVAEFSDPLSLDVEGLPRGGTIPRDELSGPLAEWVGQEYPDSKKSELSIFSFAEALVYAHADEIIFTNVHQKTTMLSHIDDELLRRRVAAVSTVSNHPTLPREYYQRQESPYVVDDSVLNLGYFGEFYSSRSITEVTSAMRSLPPHLANRVHLHVFTNYIPATEANRRPRQFSQARFDDLVQRAYDGVGAEGIEDQVTFNASLPYLNFLATTEQLDYLIVNDARSGSHHNVNPYLPSKWSDYAGSSARSWAFVENGSVLSTKPADVKTPVGDAYAAREALWGMIEDKFPHLAEKEN